MELYYQSPRGAGGEAAAGGWVRGIGCGTCNDNSIEKDGRACEAAGVLAEFCCTLRNSHL